MSQQVTMVFRFALGEEVQWTGFPGHLYTVVWRKWHQGTHSSFITYGLQGPARIPLTAYEPDILGKGDPLYGTILPSVTEAPGAL